jgi:putative transposase
MKKHISLELNAAIKNHVSESRKEWIIWMMERAGMKNRNSSDS